MEKHFENKPVQAQESMEKGSNVQILLKFIRHGERDLDGRLTDHGRKVTRQRAEDSDITGSDFDAVKAIGSDAGESSGAGARALETADIYTKELAGDEAFNTRVESILNYETLKSEMPFDYKEVYNSHIPENFGELSDEDKAIASKNAQTNTVKHLMDLETPEAVAFRKESAGAFAKVVVHYCKLAKRLNPDSKVLIPAGAHGGTMEMLLHEALVVEEDGETKPYALTGEFSPSEAYNVDIQTDDNSELKELRVTFDNPERDTPDDLYIDIDKVRELAEFYDDMHEENNDQ